MSNYEDLEGGNLITNTQIKHGMFHGWVEDDYGIASNNSSVKALDLGTNQSAKINSLIFHNVNSSNSYSVSVAICSENATSSSPGSSDWANILSGFVIPPNTTFIAIDTTTPITLVDNYELRIVGNSGSETNVSFVGSYEYSTA